MIDRDAVLEKMIKMFTPYSKDRFLDYDGEKTICGPNDRAMMGFDTNFPKEWLIEDFDFSDEEADWLISKVRELAPAD
ncbi:hypothetical protein ABIA95_000152 [Bradyrhizobium sp. LA8.1]|uniref:hypothetical protein n=1 Tax=unclassified Bradyrhizobium TaxID=2631580 RepID=UPI0033952211